MIELSQAHKYGEILLILGIIFLKLVVMVPLDDIHEVLFSPQPGVYTKVRTKHFTIHKS